MLEAEDEVVGRKRPCVERVQREELLLTGYDYGVSRPEAPWSKHETHNKDVQISNYRATEIMGTARTASKGFQQTPGSWQNEAHRLKVQVTLMGRWFWQYVIPRVISFRASVLEVSSPQWRFTRLFRSCWGKTNCCPKDLTMVSKVNGPQGSELFPPLTS